MTLVDIMGFGLVDPILEAVRIQPWSISDCYNGQNWGLANWFS